MREVFVSKFKCLLQATVLALPVIALSAAAGQAQQQPGSQAVRNLTPVTDAMLRDPPASDWLMWRRTYNGWGYSPLDQINKDNVKNLQVAWSWSLTNGATGDLIWEYKRSLPQKLITDAGNVLAKRNMAIYGDNLYVATSDAHIIA